MSQFLVAGFCLVILGVANQLESADDSPFSDKTSSEKKTQTKQFGTSSLTIELRESSDSATFAVLGLSKLERLRSLPPDELQKLMTIRVQQTGIADNPAHLLGKCSLSETELRFTSRFPLSPSVQYRVELSSQLTDSSVDNKPVLFSTLPKRRIAAAKVSAVYPSSDVLPENLLKFYIHFSAPMSRGEAYKRIHLMYGDTQVESPFLELGEELWDAEHLRFTLFVHPGRIKRGLKPREEKGIPMVHGNVYRLEIDSNWLGADLQPLAEPFIKKFRVIGSDSQQPDTNQWKVVIPKSNSKQPATLTFDESLDHALLKRVVSVRDANKTNVIGDVTITRNETVWSLMPTQPWKPGTYTFLIDSTLEDMAGNNLARRFETLEQDASNDKKVESEVSIEWTIPSL